MTNNLTQHALKAEWVNDEHGPAVVLTQNEDGYDDPETVLVHPWQLRAVCEHFGLIARDQQAAKTIATLQRRLLNLSDRVASLADWMAEHSDHEHADLSHEMTQIRALADLAGEWCADFDETVTQGHEASRAGRDAMSAPDADKLRTPRVQASGQLEIEA